MTDAERQASSLRPKGLSWTGSHVTAAAANVLSPLSQLRIVGAGAKPAINADPTHAPTLPVDLTFELLKDIGW